MNTKIIKKSHQKTTAWSGGETTEIYIYPENANYADANYQFRISTATVEVKASTFTALPNVKRTLLVIDGAMKLTHKDQHEIILKPFDQDQFDGGWETTSEGECIDVNLMTKGAWNGTMEVLHLTKISKTIQQSTEKTGVYILKNEANIQHQKMQQGDFIIFDNSEDFEINTNKETIVLLFRITL